MATRSYTSALRDEQARRTRATVLDAATRCFERDGYAATTMKAIAAEAGVSAQTVFTQGTKPALLLAAVDRGFTGDDEDVPLLARDAFQAFIAETDRGRKLAMLRDLAVGYYSGAPAMLRVFRNAAGGDAELAAAWQEYERRRYQDIRAITESFAPMLRLDLDQATDVYWALAGLEFADDLIRVRGWTVEAYADWMADSIERLLLAPL
ncbi:TetR/AcrR family transcriptional regulator [Pseudonocardia sp.]|uniref:TetR/AcrR family transcriptional regulator n=1 Tax=Pseudonocardia sp. TaxID=60912 RepID=UPI003D0F8359